MTACPQDAGPVYSVKIGWDAAEVSRVTFAEALAFLRANIWRGVRAGGFQAYNEERVDGAEDSASPDGLTDDESDAFEEEAERGEQLYYAGAHR